MKQLFASTPVKNYLILLFCLFQYMFIQHVEGEQKQFRVQVLPANNVWNVWVSNSGNEQYKFQLNENYLTFDIYEPIRELYVKIESGIKILDEKRSQEWILYPAENGSIFTNEEKEMYEVNVFDFDKIHLFHFGEYNVTEDNELSINIQLQNAKILENLAREKYYAVVITEPEGILSSIGSILFEKGLETTNDQLNSQIFHLNLIGNEAKSSIISKVMSLVPSPKTIKSTFNKSKSFDKPESSKSKPSFTRSLSNLLPTPAKITSAISKSNRLLSKSPSINLSKPPSKKESPSKNKRSKIEKFLASNTTPVLKVCIEKRIKCNFCNVDSYFNELYLLNNKGSYGCFQCVKEMEDDNGRAMKKELINQPKCCRKIANPILQNGTGQGFIYKFDFNLVQGETKNINFVQLVDMSPTNYSEKGFQTPFNLPADFVNLNLGNDESYGVSGSNARRSFAGIKGTRGQPTTRRKKVDMPESSSRNRNENFVGEGLQPGMSSGQVKKTLARNNSMPVNLKRNDDEEDSGQNMGQAPNPYSFPEQQQTWPQPGLNDFQRNIGPYYTHTLGPYYPIQGYYGNQQGFHDDYQPQLSHSDELLRQTDSFFSPDPSYPPNHEFVQQAPQASNNPTGSGTNDTPYVIVKPDGSTTTVTNTVNYPEGYDPNNSFVPPPATRPNKFWNGLYYQEY